MPSPEAEDYEPRPGIRAQRDSGGATPVGEPETMCVGLLGGFRVSVGTRIIEESGWRLRKAANLVKLLALAEGHRMHRERVTLLLWPNLDTQEAAANNLHRALHVARRVLEPAPATATSRYLHLRDEQLTLCPEGPVWVDVEAFESAAAAARRTQEPAAYRSAIELYAGELLPQDRFEGWAEERREGLKQSYLTLLIELARLYEDRGEHAPAIEALREGVKSEPTHEEAHVGLMRLCAMTGRRSEALLQYERLRKVLRKELDVEPEAASRRLHEEIWAGTFPPTQEETTPVGHPSEERAAGRHNLPGARTSFVGWEQEMLEVKRLLAMTRLLTLTGPGGSGKTRLALEVARDLVGAYPDGVWLVELAALLEPDLVPQAVARALEVREQPGRPFTDTLVDALHEKQMLLVLDNCEHLIDACARLVDALLGACPRLRILTTSREALGVAGEVNRPVPSLTVPEAGHPPTVQGLARYEAVRLFVDRSRSRLPAFELTPENAGAMAEVCRRLEGMPLAIELATARLTVLAVEQVAERLEDSLKLLNAGDRTAAPRHRTLRGTLEWSHELLSEPERMLFNRLSVFAGGWTLEAAEAVGAGEGIDEDDVLDLLSRLVDKSLVVARAGEEGALRYRMLEPVRQYGLERLEIAAKMAARPEADATRRRHAAWFLALAEQAEPELREQGAWLERLQTEHDNLRAALRWLLNPEGAEPGERAELGLRLAAALGQGRFWSAYGLREGLGWIERGLARSSASPKSVRTKALNEAGWLATWQGEYEKGVALLEESFAISKELGDKLIVAASLTQLGYTALHRGGHGRVAALREEAEALRRELVDPQAIAHLLVFLAMAAVDGGDHERAVALLEESLALSRELGDLRGIGMCLLAMGMAALERGDCQRAAALFEETLHVLRELKDKVGTTYCLLGVAGVASSQGRPVRAARLWGAAEALREASGLYLLSPFQRSHYDYEGHLAAARSLLDEAAWTAAWAEGRAMSPERAVEYALETWEPAPPAAPEPQEKKRAPAKEPPGDLLTHRQREVALLVARGLTNRQVAAELMLSEHTVVTHVRQILKKLGFHSRTRLAAWVMEHEPLP